MNTLGIRVSHPSKQIQFFRSLRYWTLSLSLFFSLSHHNFVYICLLSNSYTLKLVETWRNLLFRNRCSIRWWYRRRWRWQYHTVFICSNVRHIIHAASLILVLLAFVCAWEWRWMSTYKWLFKWTVYQQHIQHNFRKCVPFYALHTVTSAWFCFALLCSKWEFFICVSHP